MESIKLEGKYTIALKRSGRARRISLTLHPDGRLILTAPHRVSESAIRKFAELNAAWIEKGFRKSAAFRSFPEGTGGKRHFNRHKEEARKAIEQRVEKWSALLGYGSASIAIRNQTTRWGSCSRDGRLSFNYRLLFLPDRLADYVVVHELCHIRHFNHSRNFWDLVGSIVPDYSKRRNEIRKYRMNNPN